MSRRLRRTVAAILFAAVAGTPVLAHAGVGGGGGQGGGGSSEDGVITATVFLTTLDDYLGSLRTNAQPPVPDRSRVLDLAQVDIEHVYPQSPQAGHEDAQLEPCLDLIQNLSFWAATDNRAAQNAPFAQKAPKYQQSAALLNRELATLPGWDLGAADARRAQLLDDACKVWSI